MLLEQRHCNLKAEIFNLVTRPQGASMRRNGLAIPMTNGLLNVRIRPAVVVARMPFLRPLLFTLRVARMADRNEA